MFVIPVISNNIHEFANKELQCIHEKKFEMIKLLENKKSKSKLTEEEYQGLRQKILDEFNVSIDNLNAFIEKHRLKAVRRHETNTSQPGAPKKISSQVSRSVGTTSGRKLNFK